MQFCSQPQQHEYVESPFVPLLVLLPICLSLANCSKKRESMPIFGRHLHGVWLRGDSEVWAVGNDGFIVYSNNGGTTCPFHLIAASKSGHQASAGWYLPHAPCIRFSGAARF